MNLATYLIKFNDQIKFNIKEIFKIFNVNSFSENYQNKIKNFLPENEIMYFFLNRRTNSQYNILLKNSEVL